MSSRARNDLTEGPIFNKLFKLSLPIMATSLMQTAHSLTNMFWLSWLGEGYVAAAGLVTQFIWLSMSLIIMFRTGAEIGVAQNMGKREPEMAKAYAQNGLMLAVVFGTVFAVALILLRTHLLRFFDIESEYLANIAQQYMAIVALTVPFNFGHFVITGIFGGYGNTKLPFYINSAALVLNIALTPVFIFVFDMGIVGAAVGMVVAAVFNFILKIWAMTKYKNRPFEKYALIVKISWDRVAQILKWGVPVGAELLLFTTLFMVITRLITSFGESAIAAHQVGMQIESLSFMVASGFASAMTAFIGQNFGAGKWARLRTTFRVSYLFMAGYGAVISSVIFIFAPPLISIFLSDPHSIGIGVSYLRIIAGAQFLICIEGVATGSFRGRGQTMKPSIASISCNILRVILCYALAATALGTSGIWLGIAITMAIRAIWMLVWHKLNIRKHPMADAIVAD
ncbi:MAG: MATE family efflux transporter [Oscillospiraceae bacterium]|nr:MATE family efflux transporter [Oscillospiraceae bacterium]